MKFTTILIIHLLFSSLGWSAPKFTFLGIFSYDNSNISSSTGLPIIYMPFAACGHQALSSNFYDFSGGCTYKLHSLASENCRFKPGGPAVNVTMSYQDVLKQLPMWGKLSGLTTLRAVKDPAAAGNCNYAASYSIYKMSGWGAISTTD